MKIIHFTTNINSAGCVAKVSPYLNKEESINNWQVDIKGKEKMLRVSGEHVNAEQVKKLLRQAGFEAELVEHQ